MSSNEDRKNRKIGIDARLWSQTGVGRYIRNLIITLRQIDKVNQYVIFVSPADYVEIKNICGDWKIVVINIHWHSLQEQLYYPHLLNKENLDLMHFPYFSVPIFYKKQYIVTIHDLINDHFPTGKISTLPPIFFALKYQGYKIVMKTSAMHAKKILTVSQATKNEITQHLHIPQSKIIVTYEGVDKKIVEGKKLPIKQVPYTYFLYVGNVYPHKNANRLISAFSDILKKYPTIKLVFIGKEDYFYSRLQEQVRKERLLENVQFLGFVTDAQLGEYYQQAMAVIVPSLMEGFGLPALEAMANDCPVLASRIPSLVEICEDAALYFNPEDTLDITAKMEIIITDNKIRSEMKNKAKHIIQKFSWSRLAEQTLTVYNSA